VSVEIKIGKYISIIDAQDEHLFKNGKLSVRCGWGNTPYLLIAKKPAHRIILNAPPELLVDHINHDTLDNRRANLRLCTRSQNMWNRKRRTGTSKYKGVYWRPDRQKWRTQIYLNNIRVASAHFACEDDAARFYNEKALELFGEFAYLNEIGA
jgi:hypothetical protein